MLIWESKLSPTSLAYAMGTGSPYLHTFMDPVSVSVPFHVNNSNVGSFHAHGGRPLKTPVESLQDPCKSSHIHTVSVCRDCPGVHDQRALDVSGEA